MAQPEQQGAETFFAWADKTETTFGAEHQIKDLQVQAWRRDIKEGNAATITVTIKNERIGGLLAPGRKWWAWISVLNLVTLEVVPVGFARLTAWPTQISGETVDLLFTCNPTDFAARKLVAADALKTLPEWDPVFVRDEDLDNPDTVLEARAAFWDTDPVTHEVTVTDALIGEDGTFTFSASEVPYGSVQIDVDPNQLRRVKMAADISWKQGSTGTIALPAMVVETYTGDAFLSGFPKPGAGLQAGWSVESSSCVDVYGIATAQSTAHTYHYKNMQKEHENGDTMSIDDDWTYPTLSGPGHIDIILSDKVQIGLNDPFAEPPINIPATRQMQQTTLCRWKFNTALTLRWTSDTARKERISYELVADVQALQSDPDDDVALETITISGRDVGEPIPEDNSDGTIPITDTSLDSYFLTTRGRLSLENLLLRGAARLRYKSRSVTALGQVPFWRGINVRCRHNAVLPDLRIPVTGVVVGKVLETSVWIDGRSKEMRSSIKIGCAVGNSGVVVEVAGTPEYVDEGVLDPGIQFYTGATALVGAGTQAALGYTPPAAVPSAGGFIFPLTADQVVVQYGIVGSELLVQRNAVLATVGTGKGQTPGPSGSPDTGETVDQVPIVLQTGNYIYASAIMRNVLGSTSRGVRLELKPITGQTLDVTYPIVTEPFPIPMMVNLGDGGNPARGGGATGNVGGTSPPVGGTGGGGGSGGTPTGPAPSAPTIVEVIDSN